MKGSPDWVGYMSTGRSMQAVLNQELPQLVYTASEQRVDPSFSMPVLSFDFAFKNEEFMKFYEMFDEYNDARTYKDGHLSNGIEYLAMKITDEDVVKMENALTGKTNVSISERHQIRDATWRFHYTRWVIHPSRKEEKYVICDCYRYYYDRWCYNAAYFQHKQQLKLDGKRFPLSQRNGRKLSRRKMDSQYIQNAMARKRKREKEGE